MNKRLHPDEKIRRKEIRLKESGVNILVAGNTEMFTENIINTPLKDIKNYLK